MSPSGKQQQRSSISRRGRRPSSASDNGKSLRPTYVNHSYRDHYYDPICRPGEYEETGGQPRLRKGPRGGVVVPFPERLYKMLSEAEDAGFEDVVSWMPHGRCFVVHDPKRFVDEIMPRYFSQSKLTSFQRQVNLYGFKRLTSPGKDRGGYYHELFLRGRPDILKRLVRMRIKGTGSKSAASPGTEPDFYRMTHCVENAAEPACLDAKTEPPVSSGECSTQEETDHADLESDILYTSFEFPQFTHEAPSSQTVVTPPFKPLSTPSLVSVDDFKSLDAPDNTKEDSWGSFASLSLKSVAPSILRREAAERMLVCPVSPDKQTSFVTTDLMDQESIMVSPLDSPCPSPFTLPAMPLEAVSTTRTDTASLQFQEVDYRIANPYDYQGEANSSENSCANHVLVDDSAAPLDSTLDPLLFLDEVVGSVY